MREQFRNKLHLNKSNIEKLKIVNSIIEEYLSDGYKLTLRQLYYQLVVRNVILNKQAEYAKLSSLLVKGRMAGAIDWSAIEDRIRVPYLPYWAHDIGDAVEDLKRSYRLDRQENQDSYIELWVEKDALSNVLKRITEPYHIHLMINRGYSSCSAMYEASVRIRNAFEKGRKKSYILYLGDHDPSGLDMVRDIDDRLSEFMVYPDVKHIALTYEQIEEYEPPPNPTKVKDPRAMGYIREIGFDSWEVDALNPKTLHQIVQKEIEKIIDLDLFQEKLKEEKRDIEILSKFIKKFK